MEAIEAEAETAPFGQPPCSVLRVERLERLPDNESWIARVTAAWGPTLAYTKRTIFVVGSLVSAPRALPGARVFAVAVQQIAGADAPEPEFVRAARAATQETP